MQCKACDNGVWIAIKSAGRHLTGTDHLKTLQLAKEAAKAHQQLEREQRSDAATTALQNIQFMAQPTPVSAGPSGARRTASAAEIEMWEDFAENGANFSAGDQSDSAHISLDRLRQDADSFGLWDPEGVARGLGFGGGDLASEILEDDEEEDFLAEIMRHAGECPVQEVDEMVGRGHMTLTSPHLRLTPIVASLLDSWDLFRFLAQSHP